MAQLRLLACFAHPDDEAFSASGVLAASTAQGVDVRLVCTTYGEEGDIRQPGAATRATLGQIRYQELQRSCQVLGLQEPIMLGYRDSGWADHPAQSHPRAFVNAQAQEVVGRLVEEIRRFRPHMVLTFEPEGISGHKDHKAICRHTTAAIQVAGNPLSFPEQLSDGLQPYQPQRLFYVARLQGFQMQRAMALRQAGLDVSLPELALRDQGVPREQIHVILDVIPYLEQKLASMRCHHTQIEPNWPWSRVPREVLVAVFGEEYLIQAYPPVAADDLPLTDLCAGVVCEELQIALMPSCQASVHESYHP